MKRFFNNFLILYFIGFISFSTVLLVEKDSDASFEKIPTVSIIVISAGWPSILLSKVIIGYKNNFGFFGKQYE